MNKKTFDLLLYNSKSNSKELFIPLEKNQVSMYVCGPTVYDNLHIGNMRTMLVFDVLYKLFKSLYTKVIYIRNITDIDDKIIKRAVAKEQSISELTSNIINDIHNLLKHLNVALPTLEPRATEYIDKMQEMINTLLQNGHAYILNKHVYFSVDSFESYGSLSNIKLQNLKDQDILANNETYTAEKKNPHDFVLWKPSYIIEKSNTTTSYMNSHDKDFWYKTKDIGWDSPWGFGRPGWHLECSAMSLSLLGTNFDIHGGGADLLFPHHENENAQNCCIHMGKIQGANFWLHNALLTIDNQKMSKSLNNFITCEQLLQNTYPCVLRFLLLKTHYRHPLDYTESSLQETFNILMKWAKQLNYYDKIEIDETIIPNEFLTTICDDLNIPAGIKILHEYFYQLKHALAIKEQIIIKSKILYSLKILGIENMCEELTIKATILSSREIVHIESLIKQRSIAKQNKDYTNADKIRQELTKLNIILEDQSHGDTKWKLKK